MSAAGRSDVRRTNDHYVTPKWCIERFLEAYAPNPQVLIRPECPAHLASGATWLDPCAAKGELITTVRAIRPDVSMMGLELRPECLPDLERATGGAAATADFLALTDEQLPPGSVDFILTNPPYSLLEPFVRKALRVAKVSAWLLRINALRGDGRHRLFGDELPGMFVLPDRPSYTGRGTDATEYAWFVFGDPMVRGRWQMLAVTPEEDRKAWNQYARVLHPVESLPETTETAEEAT